MFYFAVQLLGGPGKQIHWISQALPWLIALWHAMYFYHDWFAQLLRRALQKFCFFFEPLAIDDWVNN